MWFHLHEVPRASHSSKQKVGLWLAEVREKGKTEVNGCRMKLGRRRRPGGLLHSCVNNLNTTGPCTGKYLMLHILCHFFKL